MMIICKDCRCFHPITVSDRYCGECVIGDTTNAIAINDEITGCCLFEPKQLNKPKPLTNADRIRQMTDEELAEGLDEFGNCRCCADIPTRCHTECCSGHMEWLKQEVREDATERTD